MFLVDALDDVIHLRAQPLVEQVVEHVALGLAAVVLRLLDGLQHRDDDLEVAVVDDGIGHLRVIRQPLHALDRTGQDLLALEGLHQVQQVVAQPVRIRLHRPLSVDRYHPLAAPARHAEFLGLPGFGLLLLRGHILSPVLRLLHLCRLLAGGAPAPGRGRRLGVPFSRSVPFRLSRGFVVRFCFRLSLGTEIGRGIKCLAIAGFFSRFQVSLGTGIRVGGFHVSLG